MERRSLVVENDNSYNTPVKRSNSMSKSQFLTNSVHRGSYVNPEDILTTFFKRDAFERYRTDMSVYRPVSYDSPNKLDRGYVIVDEKVSYGNPISPEEFEKIRNKKSEKPQIVTYGVGKDRTRLDIEVKKETGRATCGCCGGCAACCGDDTRTMMVQRYD